jgi:hypothetical protein
LLQVRVKCLLSTFLRLRGSHIEIGLDLSGMCQVEGTAG